MSRSNNVNIGIKGNFEVTIKGTIDSAEDRTYGNTKIEGDHFNNHVDSIKLDLSIGFNGECELTLSELINICKSDEGNTDIESNVSEGIDIPERIELRNSYIKEINNQKYILAKGDIVKIIDLRNGSYSLVNGNDNETIYVNKDTLKFMLEFEGREEGRKTYI